MKLPRNNKLLANAKRLRKSMTPHERKLWYLFLRKYPVKIYKQRIIDNFIVDFYCHAAKLVIELDGSQHYDVQAKADDAARTAMLESYGLTVLRFSNHDVDAHFDAVCDEIDRVTKGRLA